MENRDERGRFLPGNIANPHGRPRKGHTLTDALRAFADRDEDGRSARQVLAEKLWFMALQENDMAAIKYIYDRIDGTPVQTIDHGGEMTYRILLPGENPDNADD